MAINPDLLLRPYQIEGINRMYAAGGRFILADQGGFGKTAQALGFAHKAAIRRILVVAPASVLYNWQNEARMWIGREARVLGASELPDPSDQFIITQWDTLRQKQDALIRHGFKLLIADEAHRAKNPQALRTKALRDIARSIPHLLFLSGTPFLNKRIELWPLLNMIQPGQWRGINIFKREYCNDDEGADTWRVQNMTELRQHQAANARKNRAKLASAISDVFLRRTEEDVPNQLPGRIIQPVPVLLEGSFVGEYAKAKTDLIRYLREKGLPSRGAEYAEALVKIGYLRRIAGRAKVEASIELALDILEADDRSKVVLYAQHQPVVKALELGLHVFGPIVIQGSTTLKRRQELIDEFQGETGPRVAIITEAGEEGINLFRAADLIMVERGWTPKSDDQAMWRLHRIGQKRFVTIHKLIVTGTIDVAIDKLIASKRNEFDEVVDNVPRNMVRALAEEMLNDADA